MVQSAVFVAEVEPPVVNGSQKLPTEDPVIEPTAPDQDNEDAAESEEPVTTADESE